MDSNLDTKKEFLQTIEDFKSIANGSQDLAKFIDHNVLIFSKRNYMLYVETADGVLTIYAYKFSFDGTNIEYADDSDVNKLLFPQFIVDDSECLKDAKEFMQYLVVNLIGNVSSIFVDIDLPFSYSHGNLMTKDGATLIGMTYWNQVVNKKDFVHIKNVSTCACSNMSSITDSVFNNMLCMQKICKDAFSYCNSLNNISCSNELYDAGQSAFRESMVKHVDLSQTKLSSIQMFTFENCYFLQQVDLPSTLWLIDPFAFNNCTSLSTINFQSGIRYLCIADNSISGYSSALSVIVNGHNIMDRILSGNSSFTFDDTGALIEAI